MITSSRQGMAGYFSLTCFKLSLDRLDGLEIIDLPLNLCLNRFRYVFLFDKVVLMCKALTHVRSDNAFNSF
jgi:hypothetical protein